MQRFLVGSRNTTHCPIIPVLGYSINQNARNGGAASVAKCFHPFVIVPTMPQHRRSAHATVLRLMTKGALLKARDVRAQAFTPAPSHGWFAAASSNASALAGIAGRGLTFRRTTRSLLRLGRCLRSSVPAVRPAVSQHRDTTAS